MDFMLFILFFIQQMISFIVPQILLMFVIGAFYFSHMVFFFSNLLWEASFTSRLKKKKKKLHIYW